MSHEQCSAENPEDSSENKIKKMYELCDEVEKKINEGSLNEARSIFVLSINGKNSELGKIDSELNNRCRDVRIKLEKAATENFRNFKE
jgi:hypothetical protein